MENKTFLQKTKDIQSQFLSNSMEVNK